MKEYKKLIDFIYKDKRYAMFIDKKNKYYFMGINDNNQYEYLDIKEFLMLSILFSHPSKIAYIKRDSKHSKISPKVLIGGVVTALTISLSSIFPTILSQLPKEYKDKVDAYHKVYADTLDDNEFNVSYVTDDTKDEDEEFVVDTYTDLDFIHSKTIYDMDYLDLIFEPKEITLKDFNSVIDSNSKISSKFKELIKEYCKDFVEKQPEAERRVLYENLKTLEVEECDKFGLLVASLSPDALACYVRTENKIYVLSDYKYEKGTFDYQIIYHELSHAARTGFYDTKTERKRVQCEGVNFNLVTTAECLNSLFAVSLFDYEETDIAYQLQSNYYKIMVENMDNYQISDYMNHSLGYFVQKLNEENQNEEALSVLNLIQLQYDDFHNDDLKISQDQFYPIYEYISDMYYKNRINSNMTYDEAKLVTDELLEKILFDVPEEYEIDTQYFYDYLNDYCKLVNIEVNHLSM